MDLWLKFLKTQNCVTTVKLTTCPGVCRLLLLWAGEWGSSSHSCKFCLSGVIVVGAFPPHASMWHVWSGLGDCGPAVTIYLATYNLYWVRGLPSGGLKLCNIRKKQRLYQATGQLVLTSQQWLTIDQHHCSKIFLYRDNGCWSAGAEDSCDKRPASLKSSGKCFLKVITHKLCSRSGQGCTLCKQLNLVV